MVVRPAAEAPAPAENGAPASAAPSPSPSHLGLDPHAIAMLAQYNGTDIPTMLAFLERGVLPGAGGLTVEEGMQQHLRAQATSGNPGVAPNPAQAMPTSTPNEKHSLLRMESIVDPQLWRNF